MRDYQPIQTEYNGNKFRSRLEARWAVFFNRIGLKFVYEKEGFELGEGKRYLPDFWIPVSEDDDWGCWIEIKATQATKDELDKMYRVVNATKCSGFIIQGNPWPREYNITSFYYDNGSVFKSTKLKFGWYYSGYEDTSFIAIGNEELAEGSPETEVIVDDTYLERAFKSARQSQFEHGKCPSPRRLAIKKPRPERTVTRNYDYGQDDL